MGERRLGNVWITGASSGIGESFARLIDGVADNVAISARAGQKLDAMQRDGDTLISFPLDVANESAVTATVRAIENRFGGVDLAVLGAGVWQPMPAAAMDLSQMRRAMDINYFGVVNAVNAVLPGMKARGGGHIVIVASVAGYRGLPTSAAYGPTKAALIHLAETLAIELSGCGIDVTLVNPGFVDTPMVKVNHYNMPGLMSTDDAAKKMLAGIMKRKEAVFFPLVFTSLIRLSNILPHRFYYWAVRRVTGAGKRR
ncbi:SDR family NAD(P)-dependent oxidoreductase [Hoeflea sp. TYP-13]|uniref:SDR family NAD(P)-dependent oxidoreductase n=1 Tax=Hoeflea sp. TYP-13 TaxID=3230023 RepID=UPI0034C66CC4